MIGLERHLGTINLKTCLSELRLKNGIKKEPEENTNHFDPCRSNEPILDQIEGYIKRRYIKSTYITEILQKFQSE